MSRVRAAVAKPGRPEGNGNALGQVGKYSHLSREELIALLERRERDRSRIGLNWSSENAERDRALNDAFVTLRLDPNLSTGLGPWPNLLIEGDNFDALRWLRTTLRGRFKCIYVDPPYNTGAGDWVYNDRYHAAGDFFQTTWLEFLHRRFLLARDLLADDGVMLISINDENRAKLELMLDQTLPGMRIGSFTWRTKDTGNDAGRRLSQVHEHILIYGGSRFTFNGEPVDLSKYRNPDNDLRGAWAPRPLTKAHTYKKRANTYYPIQNPVTKYWYPCDPDNVWRYAIRARVKLGQKLRAHTIDDLIDQKLIYFPPCNPEEVIRFDTMGQLLAAVRSGKGPVLPKKKTPLLRDDLPDLEFWVGKPIAPGRPSFKEHLSKRPPEGTVAPVSTWIAGINEEVSSDDELDDVAFMRSPRGGVGTDDLVNVMGSKVFDFPKPVSLIKALLRQSTAKDSLVLDFFAGSGTTAQAIMELNQEDSGSRRFILVSHDEATQDDPKRNLAREVMRERIQRLNDNTATNVSSYAYLRTHQIPIDALMDGGTLTPEDVWFAVLAINDIPLLPYAPNKPIQLHEGKFSAVGFCDQVTSEAIAQLKKLAEKHKGLRIYTWTPGPVRRALEDHDVEIYRLPHALHDRFVS
jgi:adenine-specific DNA-methyltransferase